MTAQKSFPKPSELPVPAGAEGWEKIYPYYLVFQDQLKDAEDAKFWFCDSQHAFSIASDDVAKSDLLMPDLFHQVINRTVLCGCCHR